MEVFLHIRIHNIIFFVVSKVWFKNRRAKFRKEQRRHLASEREHRFEQHEDDLSPTYITPMYYPPPHGQISHHQTIPHYWTPSIEWTSETSMLPVSGACYGHAHAPIVSTHVPSNSIHVPEVAYNNLVLQRAHARRDDMWGSCSGMF